MIGRYAIVQEGEVTNVVIWDGESPCPEADGAIGLKDDSPVSIGYKLVGGEWVAPQLPPETGMM